MPPLDQGFYEQVLRRIKLMILILGLAGGIAIGIWKGLRFGSGFLIGASASYLSFWRWQRLVESIGSAPVKRSPWMLAIRFLMLLSIGYVIIKLTGADPGAALIGLLVPAAAVTLEILYELTKWNTNQNSG